MKSLNLDDKNSVLQFLKHINRQRKNYQYKIFIKFFISLIVIYQIFRYLFDFLEILFQDYFYISVLAIWILLIIMFFVYYLFFRSNVKLSSSLLKFIEMIIEPLDFKLSRSYKYIFYYIFFNSISIVLMTMLFAFQIPFPAFIYQFFLIFILSCLIIPIIYGSKNDKYFIKLKKRYFIQLNFRGKTLKIDGKKIPTIGIFMISNRFCTIWNKNGTSLINNISHENWLPKRGRFQIFFFSIFRYLREYATILNFEDRFINLTLAIKEWDKKYSKSAINY